MDPTWFAAIAQTGAMGILAYHFLVGLPAILDRIAKEQITMMQFFASQMQMDRTEFSRRNDLLAEEIRELAAMLSQRPRDSGPKLSP